MVHFPLVPRTGRIIMTEDGIREEDKEILASAKETLKHISDIPFPEIMPWDETVDPDTSFSYIVKLLDTFNSDLAAYADGSRYFEAWLYTREAIRYIAARAGSLEPDAVTAYYSNVAYSWDGVLQGLHHEDLEKIWALCFADIDAWDVAPIAQFSEDTVSSYCRSAEYLPRVLEILKSHWEIAKKHPLGRLKTVEMGYLIWDILSSTGAEPELREFMLVQYSNDSEWARTEIVNLIRQGRNAEALEKGKDVLLNHKDNTYIKYIRNMLTPIAEELGEELPE